MDNLEVLEADDSSPCTPVEHDSEDSDSNSGQSEYSSQIFASLISFLINHPGSVRITTSNCKEPKRITAREFLANYPPNTDNVKESHFSQQLRTNSGHRWKGCSLPRVLREREVGHARHRGVACTYEPSRCASLASRFVPNTHRCIAHYRAKAFIGRFSQDGNVFLTGSQDARIRLYNYDNGQFSKFREVEARDVGWSIVDIAFSPDQQFIAYSSWCDYLHLVNVHSDCAETHVPLDMRAENHGGHFCAFSVQFSQDNREIMAGCNGGDIFIYDRLRTDRVLCINAHEDDVNATCFADSSSQILFSGSDDGLVKAWDRRSLRQQLPKPVAVFAGHFGGITCVSSKGDGRYLISNSKDHSIKLWDVRLPARPDVLTEGTRLAQSHSRNYRWLHNPSATNIGAHKPRDPIPGDPSIMTYRGHMVSRTLVQCRFSPMHTTGQRYIYTGCASGACIVYDALTGKIEEELRAQQQVVRDVAWHPEQQVITTASWDGTVCAWTHYCPPCCDDNAPCTVSDHCEPEVEGIYY